MDWTLLESGVLSCSVHFCQGYLVPSYLSCAELLRVYLVLVLMSVTQWDSVYLVVFHVYHILCSSMLTQYLFHYKCRSCITQPLYFQRISSYFGKMRYINLISILIKFSFLWCMGFICMLSSYLYACSEYCLCKCFYT